MKYNLSPPWPKGFDLKVVRQAFKDFAIDPDKADPTLAHIPVVFLSAKGQEAEVRTGLEAGAVEYILKPFAPDQLAAKIQSILDQAE